MSWEEVNFLLLILVLIKSKLPDALVFFFLARSLLLVSANGSISWLGLNKR